MKERPILFTPENAQKVHVGAKTQTRRVIWPQPVRGDTHGRWYAMPSGGESLNCYDCPYGTAGDLLYVKEGLSKGPAGNVCWRRDGLAIYPLQNWIWQRDTLSPLHMPKWACRTWLEITDVRAERLWAISYDDEGAEGITPGPYCNDRHSGFVALWESIHGPGAWERNDWVWVITYRKVEP